MKYFFGVSKVSLKVIKAWLNYVNFAHARKSIIGLLCFDSGNKKWNINYQFFQNISSP